MKRGLLLIIFSIFLISLTSSQVLIGENSSISQEYPLGYNLSGYLNVSFDKQDTSTIIQDSLLNQISLYDLLILNPNYGYDCENNCEKTFSSKNSENSKSFVLEEGQQTYVGFKFTGDLFSIDSFKFNFSSDAADSCLSQFELDLLNDEKIDLSNTVLSEKSCGQRDYSCYSSTSQDLEATLTKSKLCQRFSLNKSPGVRFGAYVKKVSANSNDPFISVYNFYGESIGSCNLNSTEITSSGNEVYCDLEEEFKKGEYYACLSVDDFERSYKIYGNTEGDSCGFLGVPPKEESASYSIFAEELMYGQAVESEISYSGNNVLEYISSTYGSLDCKEGCVVPLRIKSNANQNLNLDSLKISYSLKNFPGMVLEDFSDLELNYPIINSDFQKLSFSGAGFILPQEKNEYEYEIKLGEKSIFKKTIKIIEFSLDIVPKIFPVYFPTKINVYSDYPAKNYFFDFGDGKRINSGNSTNHTYNLIGEYVLRVSFNNSYGQEIFKDFDVKVLDSKEIMESKKRELNARIINLESRLEGLDFFIKNILKEYLELDSISTFISNLKNDSSQAEVAKLVGINLPEDLSFSEIENIDYFRDYGEDEISFLKSVQGINGTFEEEKISNWATEKVSAKGKIKDVYFIREGDTEHEIRFYSYDFSSSAGNIYFFWKSSEDLNFVDNASVKNMGDYNYLLVNSGLDFYIFDRISNDLIEIFIAPELKFYESQEVKTEEFEEKNRRGLFYFILFILLALLFASYYFLNEWYRKNYESTLFKNRNDLYNILDYTHRSKVAGEENKKIRDNLKKVGWTGEQINYALKKYEGKNTGLPKFLGKLKVKKLLKNGNKPSLGNKNKQNFNKR